MDPTSLEEGKKGLKEKGRLQEDYKSKSMVEAGISLEQKPPKEGVRLMRFGRLVKGMCSWSPPAPPGVLTFP